jgi:hypothetical protein
LADNALFEAYLAGRTTIEANDVERAAADLGIGPDPGATFIAPTPVAPRSDWSPPAATLDSDPQGAGKALPKTDEIAELELSNVMSESQPEALECVLEEAELTADDGEELAGVFVELIEE